MKKKVLGIVLASALVLSLGLVFAGPAGAHTESDPQVQTLYAGQTIDVGDVSVWNDSDNLYVKYDTTGGWEMVKTHLHVADGVADIPQSAAKGPKTGQNGNPIPGQFDYQMEHARVTTYTYTIPLGDWEPCTDLYIAAQAEVIKESADYIGPELVLNGGFETPVVSDTTTYGWQIYDSGTAGLEWAVAWYDGSTSYGGQTRPEPAHLELMNGTGETAGWTANAETQWAELDTDWDGPLPSGRLNNEPASVTISQGLATACPYCHCKLTYAWAKRPNHANNGLEVKWDGVQQATHSGAGGSTISWSVNTITGLSPNPSGTTTLAFTETGTPNSYGMFLDSVSVTCTVVEEETAWGDGTDFPGKNWATYIEYHVQGGIGEAGDGWTDVAYNYEWEARARHGGAGGWRAFIGESVGDNALWTGGIVPWLNGGQMWFELIYDDDTNSATFTIYRSSDDYVLGTVTDSSVPGFDGWIAIQGKTSPEAAGSVVVDNVEVNGIGLFGDDGFTAQGTDFVRDLKYLDISAVLSGSFTLTGDLIFTWGAHPSSEGPALSIYVQNIP